MGPRWSFLPRMFELRPALVASVFALSLSLIGCGSSYMQPPAEPSLLAQPEAPTDVRAAIVLALADRKFKTEAEEGNKIVAHYQRKESGIRVVVDYDGSRYTVHLLGVRGYKTKQERGEYVVEKRVGSALKGLYTAINRELARPAKERAEAEKKQRDYEMQMQAMRTSQAQAEAQSATAQQQPQDQGGQGGGEEGEQGPPNAGWDATFKVTVPLPQIHPPQVQTQTSVYSGSCCINGAKYSCPNAQAFQMCSSMNPSACTPAGSCR
jgi:hypothetical protein